MSGEMVPPQYSPSHAARSLTAHDRAKCPRRRARSFDEGVTKSREKRGSARRKAQPCQKMQLRVLTFGVRITIGYSTLPPPRGHHFAYRLNQRRTERRAFFIQAANGSPGYSPSDTTSARSPLAVVQRAPCQKRGFGAAHYQVAREARFRATFSVPHHLWGAAQVTSWTACLRAFAFRERPRTIEVQRTTSSPQNHRKSLAQYSVVLFI